MSDRSWQLIANDDPRFMSKNIGFISTRFAGQDGVSLESAKWAEVLWEDEHVSYWYSGQSDRDWRSGDIINFDVDGTDKHTSVLSSIRSEIECHGVVGNDYGLNDHRCACNERDIALGFVEVVADMVGDAGRID